MTEETKTETPSTPPAEEETPQPVTKKTPDAVSGPGRLLPRDSEEGVVR
jgi:hypothetical protein